MQIGNLNIICSSKEEKFLRARSAVVEKYCIEQGWPIDPGKLSIEQILEIRKQNEWKRPPI